MKSQKSLDVKVVGAIKFLEALQVLSPSLRNTLLLGFNFHYTSCNILGRLIPGKFSDRVLKINITIFILEFSPIFILITLE